MTSVGPEHHMSYQAYLDTVEKKTGKTPVALISEARSKGLAEHKDLMAWLKGDYELGHGHANAMAQVIKSGPQISKKHVGSTGSHRDDSETLRLDGIKNRSA